MKIKKIKTMWRGQIAVEEHLVQRCISRGLHLQLKYKNEVMVLSPKDLFKYNFKSKDKYYSKWDNKWYHLYYYTWKPKLIQQSLGL